MGRSLPIVRVLGGAMLGFVAWMVLRPWLGIGGGLAAGVILGGLAARYGVK